MNTEQPVWPRNFGRSPEDIDGHLHAFFRAAMPDPWPVLKVPARPVARPSAPAPPSRPRWHSRFALAATIALCLVGSLVLAAVFPPAGPAGLEPASKDLIGTKPDLPGHKGAVAPEPFTVKTPSGHTIKGWEQNRGNTTIIKVEWVDPPDGE